MGRFRVAFHTLLGLLTCFWSLAAGLPARAGYVFSALAGKATPSVVDVLALDENGKVLARGCGFFAGQGSQVVTCRHVLEGASQAQVKTADGRTFPVTFVTGDDWQRDLVQVSVAVPSGAARSLPALTMNRYSPALGEELVVIAGVSGSKPRITRVTVRGLGGILGAQETFQLNVALPPESSGSPVINAKGEVVGIAGIRVMQPLEFTWVVRTGWVLRMKLGNRQALADWAQAATAPGAVAARQFWNSGWESMGIGDWEGGLPFFQKAIENDPGLAEAYWGKGRCLERLGRAREAIQAIEQALSIKPDFFEAVIASGLAYGELDNWDEAIKAYQQAVRIIPDNADAYNNLGIAYVMKGRLLEGIEAYRQAIVLRPDYAEAYVGLGSAYDDQRRFGDAIDMFKHAILIKPELAEAHLNLGVTYAHQERWSDAVDAFQQAIRLRPDLAIEHYNLGVAYIKLKRWNEAVDAYKAVLRLQPNNAKAYFGLGLAYGDLGRWDEAAVAYKAAIHLDPDDEEAYFNLGKTYSQLERWEEAAGALRECIRLKPNLAMAHFLLGLVDIAMINPEAAKEEYVLLKNLDDGLAERLFDTIKQSKQP